MVTIEATIMVAIPSAAPIEPDANGRPIHGSRIIRIPIRNYRRCDHDSRPTIENAWPTETNHNPLRLCSRSRCHQQTTSQRRRCQHLDCVELHVLYVRDDISQFHCRSSCTALRSAVQLDKRNPTHRVARNFFRAQC